MHLKLLKKEQFKKQQKQLEISLVTNLIIELLWFQKIYKRVIEKQLHMSMIKKYLMKDIYLQNKDRKLLMIRDQYNSTRRYNSIIQSCFAVPETNKLTFTYVLL